MANVSDGSVARTPEAAADRSRPRRIRLVKAMAAIGRAKEARPAPSAAPAPHSRSRKLSHADEMRLEILKRRLASQGLRVKKGELLSTALSVLADLDDASLRQAIAAPDEAAPGPAELAS